jgi:hypothetical protein
MDSQVVEVAIGLSVTFFFVALIASGVVESIAKVFKKRAKDLEATIEHLLGGPDPVAELKATSVYRALQGGSGRGGAKASTAMPSYMSARAFADATIELVGKVKGQVTAGEAQAGAIVAKIKAAPLGDRLIAIESEVGADLNAAKADLEAWFDDTMQRLQGAYTRWAKLWLAVAGLGIALVLNVSVTTLTAKLWTDPVLRQSVVASAGNITSGTAPTTATDATGIEAQVKQVDGLKLPIGWASPQPSSAGGWIILGLGWFLTAFAAMLGAPFWFDLLRRLTTMAGVRPDAKPLPAAQDPQAASFGRVTVPVPPAPPPAGLPAPPAGQAPVPPPGQPAGADVFGTTFVPTMPVQAP